MMCRRKSEDLVTLVAFAVLPTARLQERAPEIESIAITTKIIGRLYWQIYVANMIRTGLYRRDVDS